MYIYIYIYMYYTHTHTHTSIYIYKEWLRCSRSVLVKVLDWGIIVSEFELHPRYYV